MNKLGGALFIGVIFLFTSCTTFTVTGLQQGLTPSGSTNEIIGNFTERVWVNKFFGSSAGTNLFNITSHATDGVVARAIAKNVRAHKGTGVINLEVTLSNNPLQWILNTVTLNIWAPATVVIKGTVIKQH